MSECKLTGIKYIHLGMNPGPLSPQALYMALKYPMEPIQWWKGQGLVQELLTLCERDSGKAT